ncbi:MAG: hypothetical protein KME64_37695 [Scytonematopsis contorta HA4267-MV1]|jgi:hypothetical protein|nr:hypothetical protein [Scytonematopsis contorta HA4267-MV1]
MKILPELEIGKERIGISQQELRQKNLIITDINYNCGNSKQTVVNKRSRNGYLLFVLISGHIEIKYYNNFYQTPKKLTVKQGNRLIIEPFEVVYNIEVISDSQWLEISCCNVNKHQSPENEIISSTKVISIFDYDKRDKSKLIAA